MIFDRYGVNKGQKVWVMLDGEPQEIIFNGLRPYRGFYHLNDKNWNLEAPHDDATFASTKEEIIQHWINTYQSLIGDINQKITTLRAKL